MKENNFSIFELSKINYTDFELYQALVRNRLKKEIADGGC